MGKHVQEDKLKTINNISIVGDGNIHIQSDTKPEDLAGKGLLVEDNKLSVDTENLIGEGLKVDSYKKLSLDSTKTINGESILGEGDIKIVVPELKLKTINGETIEGEGDISIESGIKEVKTINGESLIGKGNLSIETGIKEIKTVNGQSLVGSGNITVDMVLPDKLEKGKYYPAYLGGEYYGLDKNGLLLSKYPKGSYPIRAVVELNSLGLKVENEDEGKISKSFGLDSRVVSGAIVSNNGEDVRQFTLSSDSFESVHREGIRDEHIRFGHATIDMHRTDYIGVDKTDKSINTIKFSLDEGVYVERDVKDINNKIIFNRKIGINKEGVHFLSEENSDILLKCKKNVLSFNKTIIPKTVNGALPDETGNVELDISLPKLKTINGESIEGIGDIVIDLTMPDLLSKETKEPFSDPADPNSTKTTKYLVDYKSIVASTSIYSNRYRKDILNKSSVVDSEKGIIVTDLEQGKLDFKLTMNKEGLKSNYSKFTSQGSLADDFNYGIDKLYGLTIKYGEGSSMASTRLHNTELSMIKGNDGVILSNKESKLSISKGGKGTSEYGVDYIKLIDKVTKEPVTITVENGIIKIV